MQQEIQKDEIGADLALHQGFQIEIDVGLAGQTDVVAQDPESVAVGDDAPEMILGTVEKL